MNYVLKILEILCGIILTALGLLLSYFLIQYYWSDFYINFWGRHGRWYTTLLACIGTIGAPILGLCLPWVITKMIFHWKEFMADTKEDDESDNVSKDSSKINSDKDY